jgi:hypothetical protein
VQTRVEARNEHGQRFTHWVQILHGQKA